MIPTPAELAEFNRGVTRARAHYEAMPTSFNSCAYTPCNGCQQPTQRTSGLCRACSSKEKR